MMVLEGLRVTRLLYLQPTWEILQISKSQFLSNILYHIDYSSDYTGSAAGYPTFFIAYLVYSTSHSRTRPVSKLHLYTYMYTSAVCASKCYATDRHGWVFGVARTLGEWERIVHLRIERRGLRLGSDTRAQRTRARDSGSSAYARTREKSWYLRPAATAVCKAGQEGNIRHYLYRHNVGRAIYMARPSLLPRRTLLRCPRRQFRL